MDKNLMDALYVSYDEKIGVLCDDEDNTISHVLGTDLTLVLDKKGHGGLSASPIDPSPQVRVQG